MRTITLSTNIRNFSIFCLSFLVLLLIVFFPRFTLAATLFMSPSSSSVTTGNIFTVNVIVNTEGQSINTSDAVIQFPTDILQVVSVSKSSSIFSLWVEDPNFSNTTGQISFNGGIANPGYLGSYGQLISITFQAKKTGSASILFSDSSVRANDGLGTDVLSTKAGAKFTVTAPVAPTPTKPDTVPVTQPINKPVQVETVEPIVEEVAVEVRTPEISVGIKNGIPTVTGESSYADHEVTLSFISSDGTKIFITDKTLSDGSFSLTVPKVLRSGSYSVTAILSKTNDDKTYKSNQIEVSVANSIKDIGLPVLSFIGILLLVIIGLLLYIFTHLRKHKSKSSLKHDLHETEDVLHKSFDILREDVSDFAHEKMHSSADRKNVSAIEKEIDDAENVITSQIKNIEK